MNKKFAIVVSQFNDEVTGGLLKGALQTLTEYGAGPNSPYAPEVVYAPGAFEMPLIAQTLAKTKRYSGVICLGCVIKGDTAHFEFISLGAAVGLMQASLATEVPLAFGILTTYTDEQAHVRSRAEGEHAAHNKGIEAARACIASAELLAKIRG